MSKDDDVILDVGIDDSNVQGDLDQIEARIEDWAAKVEEENKVKVDVEEEDGGPGGGGPEGGKMGAWIAGATRLVTIITAAAAAAAVIYEWGVKAAKAWYETEAGLERQKELLSEVSQMQSRLTQEGIERANELTSIGERRVEIEKQLEAAATSREHAEFKLGETRRAAAPGALGQWYDGESNENLETNHEVQKQATEDAIKREEALRNEKRKLIKLEKELRESSFERLEMESAKLTMNSQQYERLKLIKSGLSEEDATQIAFLSEQNRLMIEQQQVTTAYEKQVETLRLRNTELTKGEEAARRQRDSAKGFSEEQIQNLASLRAANEAILQQEEDKKKVMRDVAELDKFKETQDRSESRISGLRDRIADQQQRDSATLGGFSGLAELGDRIANAASKDASSEVDKRIEDLNRQILAEQVKQTAAGDKLAEDNVLIVDYLKTISTKTGGLL